MTRSELESLIEGPGYEPIVLADRIVILPHAGRVIGLFPTDAENALWVNESAFASAAEQDGWPNHGGDRVWISPEQDTLIAKQPDGSLAIAVPPQLDPAGYAVIDRGPNRCTLGARATLRFRRAGVEADLAWSRRIEAIREVPLSGGGVDGTGYRVTTALRAEGSLPDGVQPAVWSILQVPPHAQITIPTRRAARHIHAFIGTPTMHVDERGTIRCEVDADASFKYGLQIGDSFGLSVAEYGPAAARTLVVRAFDRFPREAYSDVAADGAEDHGFVHQVYVDDGALGGFGEIEHHSPYLREENDFAVADTSRTYAYRGAAEAIARVRDAVLNQEVQV